MSTAEIRAHWSRVAALGCIVSGRSSPTLHHVHGGSVKHLVHKGMGQKVSDWLVIPLAPEYHTGAHGIDLGCYTIEEWERRFGSQADHLDEVCRSLGVNVWQKAGIDREVACCS